MPNKSDVLRAKMRAIRTTLERTPPQDKKSPAGLELAKSFNALLSEIAEHCPDIAGDLPNQIPERGALAAAGRVGASYLDIEILAEQSLALLDLLDD